MLFPRDLFNRVLNLPELISFCHIVKVLCTHTHTNTHSTYALFLCFLSRLFLSATYYICHVANVMAGALPNPVRWECHICNAGPYLYVNTTRCTNIRSNGLACDHDFCHEHCKKDNDIQPPLSSAQSSIPGLRSAPNQVRSTIPARWLRTSTNISKYNRQDRPDSGSTRLRVGGPSYNHNPPEATSTLRFANRHDDAQTTSRPSTAGWWRCGVCREANNPAMNTGRCWNCAHPGPCPCCSSY